MNDIKVFQPVIILFAVSMGLTVVFSSTLQKAGVNSDVLIGGNLILFLLTLLTIFLQKRALNNANPNVFIRSVMSGMFLKMVVVAVSVIVYYKFSGDSFSKSGVFISLLLYLVYLSLEVYVVSKLNRKKHA